MGKFHSEIPPLFGHRLSQATVPIGAALDDTDPVAKELIEATTGKFDVIGVLGRSDFASVYLATDAFLKRQVAIKVIRLAANEDRVAADQFRRDSKLLGSLNHPHIVPAYRIKQVGRLVYFAMRYIDGRGLDRILDEHGPLPIDVTRLLVGEIADGLDLSHEYGILHRDVKPANIIIGRDGAPNVTDFGFAHISRGLTRTITARAPSMPYYMSPEQCSDGVAAAASDQYSLAAVAYHMLTGRPPFDADSAVDVKRAHITDRPVPLSDLRDDVPDAVGGAVHRALSKNPADRWPTIAAFAMAMASDVMSNRSAIRTEISALVGTPPGTDAPAAADAAVAATAPKKRPPPQSRRAKRRARRWRTLLFIMVALASVAAVVLVPRELKQRAAAERVAARILQGPGDSAAAAAARARRAANQANTRSDPVGPPPRVLGAPSTCGLIPAFSTHDLIRRNKAILRVCVSYDHTGVTIGGTLLGITASGVRDVEVDPGTYTFSTSRERCQTRGGSVTLVAGEFHVVQPHVANPICSGGSAGQKP